LGFALFASHDAVIKSLGGQYAVFQIVFFATLFFFPLLIILLVTDTTSGNLIPKNPKWIAARVLASVIATPSIFYAFTKLELAEVYTLLFTTPLWVTAMSVPVLREKVGIRRWGAVLVGFAGVLVVLHPGSIDFSFAHFAALVGAFGAGFVFITMRKIGNAERTQVLMIYQALAMIVFMGLLMAPQYRPMALPDMVSIMVLSALGFCGMLAMIAAYRRAGAAVVAPMQYSQLIWATVFGVLFFAETPDRRVFIGAAIIISSGMFILWREHRLTPT